ncbi:MAG: hypothetical protein HY042_04455 [Spirochaetia bacterium]|nr:hypothetical protein [Spirochaetia bacterium]
MPAAADVVVLRGGARYDDVKTQPSGESHRILFKDGHINVVPNSQIKSLRRAPTTWTEPVRPEVEQPKKPVEPQTDPRDETPRIEPVVKPAEPTRNWGPVFKSALLPGWGQYDEGRSTSAAVYAATYLFAVQRYWTLRNAHAVAQADYNDPLPVGSVAGQTLNGSLTVAQAAVINFAYLSNIERRVHRLQKQGNEMVLIISVAWGWNMLDILRGGTPWERQWFGGDRGLLPILRIQMQRDSIAASMSLPL